PLDESCGIPAIDDPVVEACRNVHHPPRHELRAVPHRPDRHSVDPEDCHFGMVDDRRRGEGAERPQRGDREGGAGQLLARRLSLARSVCQSGDFTCCAEKAICFCVAQHRHDKPVRRHRRNAEVNGVVSFDDAFIVEKMRIHLRVIDEGALQRRSQEGKQGQLRSLAPLIVHRCAQILQRTDVNLFDHGNMGNAGIGQSHAVGNLAPKTDHGNALRALLSLPRGSRGWRR
ncbi:conserved hypothetical protein, partial [Ricinus communis]